MAEFDCEETKSLVHEYLHNELGVEHQEGITTHLALCDSCEEEHIKYSRKTGPQILYEQNDCYYFGDNFDYPVYQYNNFNEKKLYAWEDTPYIDSTSGAEEKHWNM